MNIKMFFMNFERVESCIKALQEFFAYGVESISYKHGINPEMVKESSNVFLWEGVINVKGKNRTYSYKVFQLKGRKKGGTAYVIKTWRKLSPAVLKDVEKLVSYHKALKYTEKIGEELSLLREQVHYP